MKRFVILTGLAIVASASLAQSVLAGAFGVFYNPLYCDKKCGAFVCAANAFSPSCGGCCPGPCWSPPCAYPGHQPLGPVTCAGTGSFGNGGLVAGDGGCCGGCHVRKLFSKKWSRCAGGGCGVGEESFAGYGHEAPIHMPAPANNHPAVAPPVNHLPGNGISYGRTAVPYWTANGQQWQQPYFQPVSYTGYGAVPVMPMWDGTQYGYYPPMPVYPNPAMWAGYGW